jgi:hypothetical protein
MPNVLYTEGIVVFGYFTASNPGDITISRDIYVGEEVFIDFGDKFSYWKG